MCTPSAIGSWACADGTFAALFAVDDSTLSHTSAAGVCDLRPDRASRVHVTVAGYGGRDRRAGIVVHRSRLDAGDVIELDGFDLRELERMIERSPRRAGVRALRELLIEWDGRNAPARSALEERFLALCRRSRLPPPLVNSFIEGLEVDFAWPDRRVIVEVDGFAFHGGSAAFERDRARDATLVLAGWRVLRFGWRQITLEPDRVAAVIARCLAG